MVAAIDLTGQRFGRLVALRPATRKSESGRSWECACDCGGSNTVAAGHLRRGLIRSCGCLRADTARVRNATHGLARTRANGGRHPLYDTWVHMRQRCENPTEKRFPYYGGRGITVCERWRDFPTFAADVGPRPSPRHSLDRIDPDGHYEPGNVRWATQAEQNRNRRNTRRLTINGETRLVCDWARAHGLRPATVAARLRKGWDLVAAVTAPLAPGKRPAAAAAAEVAS